MSKLIYLPLEPYIERYTYYMSCVNGWAETHFKNNNVEFIRVDGEPQAGKINVGSVLDAYGRSLFSINQTAQVIKMIQDGQITSGDVIYCEDFWHIGIESLFYIRSMTGIQFKIGCFIHAQSVDDSDFTYKMRDWIRDIEKGFSKGYDYVFTTSKILMNNCRLAGFENIFLSGLPLNSGRLKEQLSADGIIVDRPKKKQVLFSSRFDREKNPEFFMDLADCCPDINFVLCSPREKLSNDPLIDAMAFERHNKGQNFKIVKTNTKKAYYELLAESDVQFNCAEQDWVSWTLLEATLFGCKPLYPMHKDFPLELSGYDMCLYSHLNLKSAEKKLRELLEIKSLNLSHVYAKHDKTWSIQLKKMQFI